MVSLLASPFPHPAANGDGSAGCGTPLYVKLRLTVGNFVYLAVPFPLPSLLAAFRPDGLVTVNHSPCMCMYMFSQSSGFSCCFE